MDSLLQKMSHLISGPYLTYIVLDADAEKGTLGVEGVGCSFNAALEGALYADTNIAFADVAPLFW